MARTLPILAALLTLALAALVVATLQVSRPLFDERLEPATLERIAIAPPDEALTFARYRADGALRVLLVTKYEDGAVSGVSPAQMLGAAAGATDPIALLAQVGYEALARLPALNPVIETVPVRSLELPFDPIEHNVGIGTNYVEHAREAQVEEKPFLFPKLVQPTHFLADVPQRDSRLLDYEAELGFVALADIHADAPRPAFGLVLGNDFTDRWSLVRNFDGDQEMGRTGFVEGKSREGYAPIGNLLVVPRDLDAFYREVELELYVNGRLRQKDKAGGMVWGPAQMLEAVFAREDWRFQRYDGSVSLLPRARTLPQRAIVFSGTPAGVIFKPVNVWNHWLYLQPGDEVVIRSERLGVLQNRIVD